MSFQAMTWASEQTAGGPSAKAALFAIANIANEHHVAWPSQDLIAEQSEQSPDSVARRLKDLSDKRLLKRIPLKFGGRKTVDFIILANSKLFSASLEEIEPFLPRGCEVDPRYSHDDVPADCGNDAPADCGNALPQTLPQPAENVTAPVRQQEPVTEPREPVEREARASAKEPDPDTDQDFQALLAKVVKAAGPQPVGRTYPLWKKLDDDAMRKAALEGWDTCLAEWSKGGRKHAYGLETYLREKLWLQAPKSSAEGGPKVILELRSGEWFAHFWARFLAGDLTTCKRMITMAKMRVGSSVPADAVPSSASRDVMPRIDKTSEAWRAWRQKLHAAGLLVDDDMIPAWVWVPSEWPKGMEPDAMERRAG